VQPDLVRAQRTSRAGLPDPRHLHVLAGRRQQPLQPGGHRGRADDDLSAVRDGLLHPAALPDRGRRMTVTIERPVSAPVDQTVRRRTRGRRRHATWGWNALAMVLAALIGFPIYWMLITAFKRSSDITTLTPQFWPKH